MQKVRDVSVTIYTVINARIVPFKLYILGVKNAVLVPVRVVSPKRSTAGAFAVPFRVMS